MLLGVLCSREVPRALLPAKVVHDLSNEERLGRLRMQTAVLEPGNVREADLQKLGGGRKSAAISTPVLQTSAAFYTASARAVFKTSAGSF